MYSTVHHLWGVLSSDLHVHVLLYSMVIHSVLQNLDNVPVSERHGPVTVLRRLRHSFTHGQRNFQEYWYIALKNPTGVPHYL